MPDLRLEDVIRRPIITEKNSFLMAKDQFTFEVHSESSKIQIKAAVEEAFGVTVKAVNTMNVKPKSKSRFVRGGAGRISGKSRGWKKAIVTLNPGERIDIFEQF